MDLEAKIEAILFYKAEAVTVSQLVKWLALSASEIEAGLANLAISLTNRGVKLIKVGEEVMLGTAPETSSLIEQITKEDLSRDLGKAALETLTLIIYEGPLSRAEIDYVRGVNSSFILRHLLVRGLVEREIDKKDARRFIYRPTIDLLRHLGIEKVEDLPEYEAVKKQVDNFLTEQVLTSAEQIDNNDQKN
ncbi:MAG: SMC-Scp complex subunit ScpB [Candidatus Vogelbacteria bacterium]|nr:SMC-Scp complex subunit ScpB [Candidatus Vogelbacteria bacterium]